MRSADFLCVDFGSTFTKGLLVSAEGEVLATAEHRTTLDTDVMDAFDAVRDCLGAEDAQVLACSSAGGGLRILVIGQEELVTAEAGRRVALSSGGAVAGVLSRPYDAQQLAAALDQARPDLVLLTGGTDGGNEEPLLSAAHDLAQASWRGPVVIAGNASASERAAGLLADFPVEVADNVLPQIGVLAPDSARTAVRELFLQHVIGGKHLSRRPEFLHNVVGATPEVVLRGVEVLAQAAQFETGVVVVDVGGATTDVHSVVKLDAETGDLGREVVAITPVTRTVEADLGMRWSARSTADAAFDAGLGDLRLAADRRTADPAWLPATDDELADERALAAAAVVLGVRRHAGRSRVVLSPEGRVIERTGKDLREVDLLIGSGGVFRHGETEVSREVLAAATGQTSQGWQQPDAPALAIDEQHVLAAIGLLADEYADVASALALHWLQQSAGTRA